MIEITNLLRKGIMQPFSSKALDFILHS